MFLARLLENTQQKIRNWFTESQTTLNSATYLGLRMNEPYLLNEHFQPKHESEEWSYNINVVQYLHSVTFLAENSFILLDVTITDSIFYLNTTQKIFEEIVFQYTDYVTASTTTLHRVSDSVVLFGNDRVRVFNIETKEVLLDQPNPSNVTEVLNDNTVVTISGNEMFKLYDIQSGTHRYVHCEGLPTEAILNSPLRISDTEMCVYNYRSVYVVDFSKEKYETIAEEIGYIAKVYVWDGYIVIKAERIVYVYDTENYYSKREYYGDIQPLGIENGLLYCGINKSLMAYDLSNNALTELYYFGPEDVLFRGLSNGYVQVSPNMTTVYQYNIRTKDIKKLEYVIYYGYQKQAKRTKPTLLLNRATFTDITVILVN